MNVYPLLALIVGLGAPAPDSDPSTGALADEPPAAIDDDEIEGDDPDASATKPEDPAPEEGALADPSEPASAPSPAQARAAEDLPARQPSSRERAPSEAEPAAKPRRYLGPATRPWFIHVGVGDDRPIRNLEYGIAEVGSAHFEQSIGRHLEGGYGAALALVTQQTVSSSYETYVFAGRFQHDIAVDPSLAVYLSPSLTLGYRLVRQGGADNFDGGCADPPCDPQVMHQATIQVGLGVTLIIADRLPLFIRPVTLDIGAPHIDPGDEPAISLRWHIVGGLGVSF